VGGLIPLGDASRRPRGSAFITILLIVTNALVFFQELQGGDRFVNAWSVIPYRVTHGQHTITLLTSMFMHASWMHIIGNMIFLWAFGPAMEDAMGHFSYLVFYLAGGLIAMMSQVLGDPASHVPCLGASGAIAAIMGAFIVTFPRDRIRTVVWILIFFPVTYIPAIVLIGFWFLIQVFDYGVVADAKTGGVAYLAHIAGFAFGVVLSRMFIDKNRITFSRGPYPPYPPRHPNVRF
jgi:membrane associated rhomboid family serine protease